MISIETFIQFGSSPQGIHPKVSQKNGGWETGRLVSFWEGTLKGTNISPFKGTFEDGFPFPKVGYVTFLENNFWEAILVFGRVNVKIIASTWPLYSLDSDSQQKVCRSSDFQLDCLTPCLSVSHLLHWQTKNLWSSTWLKTSLSHMKSLRSNIFKRHPLKISPPNPAKKKTSNAWTLLEILYALLFGSNPYITNPDPPFRTSDISTAAMRGSSLYKADLDNSTCNGARGVDLFGRCFFPWHFPMKVTKHAPRYEHTRNGNPPA